MCGVGVGSNSFSHCKKDQKITVAMSRIFIYVQLFALGRPAIKITGGLELVCGRPTLALVSALVHLKKTANNKKTKRIKHKQKAKWAAGLKDRWPEC